MEQLIKTGKIFIVLGIIGIGIEHFIFQDFIIGRAPAWPESISGKLIWAYLSGILIIGAGVSILTGIKARAFSVLAVLLIFGWALLRHIPVVSSASLLSGEWTSAGKALVFLGGFLALGSLTPKVSGQNPSLLWSWIGHEKVMLTLCRVFLGIFLILTGIQHFMYAEFVASLIPSWFPGNSLFWTYFAGVVLILGGIGLFITKTAPIAAILTGIMLFSWFWIVHIPRVFVSVSDSIAVFEALAFSGIALVLGGSLKRKRTGHS